MSKPVWHSNPEPLSIEEIRRARDHMMNQKEFIPEKPELGTVTQQLTEQLQILEPSQYRLLWIKNDMLDDKTVITYQDQHERKLVICARVGSAAQKLVKDALGITARELAYARAVDPLLDLACEMDEMKEVES